MKHNLIKTDNYLLVVDDSEIKEGDYFYRDSGVVSILTKELLEYYKSIKDNDTHTRYKIISHAPLNGAPYLDGVDRLPPLPLNQTKYIKEYQQYPDGTHVCIAYSNGDWFCDCGLEGNVEAEKNADLILDKLNNLYMEEDLVKAIAFGFGVCKKENRAPFVLEQIKFIQSLQQPKYPIAFECEMRTSWSKEVLLQMEAIGDNPNNYPFVQCPKTIIDSEGRTEWVGKYIYE